MKTRTARSMKALALLGVLLCPGLPCSAQVWFGEPIVTDSPFDLTLPKLGDLDNDGLLDMVARRDQGNDDILLVYLGDGSGHMSVADTIPYNGGISDFIFIDENGDGFDDIIVGGGARVYRNDGSAQFTVAGSYTTPFAFFFAGDIDRDGFEDFAVGTAAVGSR